MLHLNLSVQVNCLISVNHIAINQFIRLEIIYKSFAGADIFSPCTLEYQILLWASGQHITEEALLHAHCNYASGKDVVGQVVYCFQLFVPLQGQNLGILRGAKYLHFQKKKLIDDNLINTLLAFNRKSYEINISLFSILVFPF